MTRAFMWRHNNPEKRTTHRKQYKIRKKLRELGILPPYKSEMNEEQKKIFQQIGDGDFSYWNSIKEHEGHNGGNNENKQKKIERTPEYLLWDRVKNSAKERKINKEFNLEVSDIIIPEYCPYLGIKLSINFEDRYSGNYFTCDRIDSSKGYIKGNVQVISRKANTMKNDATESELIAFANNILKMHKKG